MVFINLFNLYARLTLDDADYKKGIANAERQTNSLASTISASSKRSTTAIGGMGIAIRAFSDKLKEANDNAVISGVKTVASWVGITLAIYAAVGAVKDLIYNTTEWAGSIKDLSQVYDMTYEQIQEVNYLSAESGKNAEWAIRKAQSTGQAYWEVLGLSNEEYQEMIANAHEMGIILSDELVDGADELGDAISHIKYQWQAVLAGLLAGDVNAEENLTKFFNRLFAVVEKFTPAIVQFIVKLVFRLAVALVQYIPQFIGLVISEIINTIFSVNWFQVGFDIIKAIIEGVINGLGELLFGWIGDIFGFEIPKLDLGVGNGNYLDVGSSYEITESVSQELTINIKSEGVTANDKVVAGSVEDLVDKKLGALLGGI